MGTEWWKSTNRQEAARAECSHRSSQSQKQPDRSYFSQVFLSEKNSFPEKRTRGTKPETKQQNQKFSSKYDYFLIDYARAGAQTEFSVFILSEISFTVFSTYQTKYQKEKNQYQQAKQNNTRNISNLIQRLWLTNKDLKNGGRCKPDVRKQRKNPVMTSSWKKNNSIRQGGDTNTYTTKHKPTSDKGRLLEIGNSDVVRCL